MLSWFMGLRSIVVLIWLCAAVFLFCYAILVWKFTNLMMKGEEKFPPPRGGGLLRKPLTWILIVVHARHSGKVWFAERDHFVLAVVAIAIAAWGFMQATATGAALNLARSGSLIVIMGFVSIFIGTAHANGLFETRRAINENTALLEKTINAERAQGLSNKWVFGITASGTFIWGYSDILGDDFFKWIGGLLAPLLP